MPPGATDLFGRKVNSHAEPVPVADAAPAPVELTDDYTQLSKGLRATVASLEQRVRELKTPQETAPIWGISVDAVYKRLQRADGAIRAKILHRVGKRFRIDVEAAKEFGW